MSDADLMERIARGDESAFRALYGRFAPTVRAIAASALPANAVDDVLQEVFVRVWLRHETFDPARGTLDVWIRQIARNQTKTHLRARRPTEELTEVVDEKPGADEARWAAYRSESVRNAIEALPAPQAQALRLAFLDELTHEEVARTLSVPLGTAKTRIRGGLRTLGLKLAAALAAVSLAVFAVKTWRRAALVRDALTVATSSDVAPIRLAAETGVPAQAHATYRAHPSSDVAILTVTALPAGAYDAWAVIDGTQIELGRFTSSDDRALLLVRDARVAHRPTEVFVTRATDAVRVLSWRAP